MTSKRCYSCLCDKPLNEFYKNKLVADGHVNKCKGCTREAVRKYRSANQEKVRAYERLRDKSPERVEKFKARYKKWYEQHPERWLANAALNRAVKRGEVTPHPCWVCGSKAEAHHPDYSRPLDVVWLCTTHHMQTHALLKRITDDR